jgi:glycine betaine/proline transport system ATP-binding protein
VLNPADAYIAKFVQEVNRGRVLLASSVMTPVAQDAPAAAAGGPAIAASATLEEALREMTSAGADAAHIVDAQARSVGRLTLDAVVAAMVTPAANSGSAGGTNR